MPDTTDSKEQVNLVVPNIQARVPLPLCFEGNVAENFKKFKQMFNIYMIATGSDRLDDVRRIAILLNLVGEEGLEIFNNFELSAEEKKDFNRVLREFETYTNPKKSVLYERFRFYNRNKEPGESFEHFIQELKTLIKSCEFQNSEEMLRDRIAFGCNDKVCIFLVYFFYHA